MEDRIKKFMEYKGISPSELADAIGVQRSNVTHVLKGRNKPSLQFMEKLLTIYPEINAKWFILGIGNMIEGSPKSKTLFDSLIEPAINPIPTEAPISNNIIPEKKIEPEINKDSTPPPTKDTNSSPPIPDKKESENELYDPFFGSEKPIERLIVFFKDQTFKVFNLSR